jgi:uncharacterized protein
MKTLWVMIGALVLVAGAQAQATEGGKKELVAKILKLQQSGIDAVAQNLVNEPAAQLWQQSTMVMQTRIAPEKREALAKAIQADIKKYVDSTLPAVRDRATKLAPSVLAPILEDKFTEDELKELIGILESPVNRRFQQMAPDMQKGLTEKLVTEMRGEVRPKVAAMEKAVSERVGNAVNASQAAPGPAAKPGSAATKP